MMRSGDRGEEGRDGWGGSRRQLMLRDLLDVGGSRDTTDGDIETRESIWDDNGEDLG